MSDAVLVTGAFGLVGSATVRHLAAAGRPVVATDLDTPANRRAAGALPAGVRTHWADLTDPAAVEALLATARPSSIIHLAAMIPPLCYATPDLARKVNVEATATFVKVAAAQPDCPRIVFASSIAVYGPRNPHRCAGLLTADTPVRPYDIYGLHKVEAEAIVRESGLAWVILRLGGVLDVEPKLNADPDLIYLAGALPTDGRLQTVDVRDVAHTPSPRPPPPRWPSPLPRRPLSRSPTRTTLLTACRVAPTRAISPPTTSRSDTMLIPRKVKHRKQHHPKQRGISSGGTSVTFGDYGIQALEHAYITNRQIESARIAINRHIKRGGKVWINIFPDRPLTKKPAETRMGSGKGSPEWWVANVKPGRVLFELSYPDQKIAREALTRAIHKLPIKARIVTREEQF